MKYRDFLALATAIVAAKRFESVDTEHLWQEDEKGAILGPSDRTLTVAGECVTIAKALGGELDLDWMDEGVKPNGMKTDRDEEFFDDEDELTTLDKIADEFHDFNDTMSHGRESIGGFLRDIAENTGGIDNNAIVEAIESMN